MTVDVRGSGSSWAVYSGGERISGYFSHYQLACDCATKKERKLRMRRRPCMCCGAMFKSEGAHNRLCDPCRRRS